MSGENRLKSLFDRRNNHWDQATKRILKDLEANVIPAAKEFAAQFSSGELVERLVFTATELVYSEENSSGAIFVWGHTHYEVGEEIATPSGEVVTLTEQDVGALEAPVEISVPLDLAANGTKDEIVKYLQESFEKLQELFQQAIEEQAAKQQQPVDFANPGDIVEQQMYDMVSNLGKEDQEPLQPLDMDLSDFTEEQKRMILLSYKQSGNTTH